ncbi:MAG: NfeD family protein [Anaerolineae bacterium]|jgi:membrane protein implicated in regulation of membrane protease activity
MTEAAFDTLNCVYLGFLFVGLGYAIFIVITGGLSDIDLPDVDIDIPQIDLPGDIDIPGADIHVGDAGGFQGGIDAPDVSISPLSPITIASFITTFGGVGIITTQFFGVDGRYSLIWAVGSALATSGVMYLVVSQFLIGSQGSSEIRREDVLGLEAEVTVPIGDKSAGKVTYVTKSGRMSSTARSATGEPIPRGELVTIVRIFGPQVLVRPISAEMKEETQV